MRLNCAYCLRQGGNVFIVVLSVCLLAGLFDKALMNYVSARHNNPSAV